MPQQAAASAGWFLPSCQPRLAAESNAFQCPRSVPRSTRGTKTDLFNQAPVNELNARRSTFGTPGDRAMLGAVTASTCFRTVAPKTPYTPPLRVTHRKGGLESASEDSVPAFATKEPKSHHWLPSKTGPD